MNQYWEISARNVLCVLIGWLAITNLLAVVVSMEPWWFLQCLLFASLVFLPGFAVLRSLRITFSSFAVGLLYSFGLGVFILMVTGLIANQLQPVMHISHPLESGWVLTIWNVLLVALITHGRVRNRQPVKLMRWVWRALSWRVWLLIGVSVALPVLACFGAFQLNNNGGSFLATTTLAVAATMIAGMFIWRKRVSDDVMMWLVFSLGLTILLMTSLRGWDIVGHDIQREFRVYTMTHMQAYWNISLDRDPYNACLSITILPEVIGRLLQLSGIVIFKFILQIIFAACTAVVYVFLRQYVGKCAAVVGSLLFICYPTFINDSAMLTRQGVAYFFFALALLAMVRRPLLWQHKVLFLLLSLGAILSHYSTAYMYVALFAGAVAGKYALRLWRRFVSKKTYPYVRPTLLSPWYASLIFLMTFVWYTQITGTSSGLFVTIQRSLANITTIFSDDNKSADTSSAIFFANKKTTLSLYQSYLTKAAIVSENSYLPTLVSDTLPLTPLGAKARTVGVDPSFITTARQQFARVLQVLALVGVTYASYRFFSKKRSHLPGDMVFLSLSAIVILALLTLLPVVSVNYGILRAFQQSLIFLVVPMTLLLARLGRRIKPRMKLGVVIAGMVFLFFLFTGFFTQLLGGASPSLALNNQGLYYGLYYSPAADAAAFVWLKDVLPPNADVRAANFNRATMHDPHYPFGNRGILPSQTRATSFIYADETQVQSQRFYTYYDSSPLMMSFPLDYYDLVKNCIYSTGSTRVYR